MIFDARRARFTHTRERLHIEEITGDPATAGYEFATPVRGIDPPEPIGGVVGVYERGGGQRRDAVRHAAAELIGNAIWHGNKCDPEKFVRVYCLWRQRFYLAVCDEGAGFDIDNPPYRCAPSPEQGFGLRLVRQRADQLYTECSSIGSAVIGVYRS